MSERIPTRRRKVPWHLAVAVLLSGLFAIAQWSDDDFWHLATGRYIVDHWTIPLVDVFTFTVPGKPWHGVPWLADLTFYAIQSAFGWSGLVAFKMLVGALCLLAVHRRARHLGASTLATCAILPLCAVLLQERLTRIRPEMLGVLCMAAWLGALREVERGQRRAQWLLGAIGLAWGQIHTSVALSWVVALANLSLTRLLRRPARWAASVLGIATLAALPLVVTANGRGVLWAIVLGNRWASPVAYGITREWHAPGLLEPSLLIPIGLCVLAALFAGRRLLQFPPLVASSVIGALLATQASRHGAFFTVMTAPAWAIGLDEFLKRMAQWFRPRLAEGAAVAFALAMPLCVLNMLPVQRNRIAFGFGIVRERYPYEALALLERLPKRHQFNELEDGGFLIWHRLASYVDGRTVHLFTDDDLRQLLPDATRSGDAIEHLADRYAIGYGLGIVGNIWGTSLMLSPHWIPLQHGQHVTVFVRERLLESAIRAGVTPFEVLRFVPDDTWLNAWYHPILAVPTRRSGLRDELVRSWNESPGNPVALGTLQFLSDVDPSLFAQVRSRLELQ